MATNCKKYFFTNEAWAVFFGNKQDEKEDQHGKFHRLLWATKEDDFDLIWQKLQNKYDPIDEGICAYIADEIMPHKYE